MKRHWRIGLAILLGSLIVLGSLYSIEKVLDLFTPGAGMSSQSPPQFRPDGGVVVSLELAVWGSGGSIGGRYKDVVLVLTPATTSGLEGQPAFEPVRISGKLVRSTSSMELREFFVPAQTAPRSKLAYHFEYEFDGRRLEREGAHELSRPPATHLVPQ
jgi:hypothetical protein